MVRISSSQSLSATQVAEDKTSKADPANQSLPSAVALALTTEEPRRRALNARASKGSAPKSYSSDAAVKKAVAADPTAIGYIDKGSVDDTVKVLLTVP